MLLLVNILRQSKSILLFLFTQMIMIITFAIIYWAITHGRKKELHFSGLTTKSTLFDFLFYSTAMQTTIGGGDIIPVSKLARGLAMIQMMMIYLGIGISERYIIQYMTSKQYWGPILIISALIIAAFAPPLSNVIVRFLLERKDQGAQLLKIPKKIMKLLN